MGAEKLPQGEINFMGVARTVRPWLCGLSAKILIWSAE